MQISCTLLCSYIELYFYVLPVNTLQNSRRPGEHSKFLDKIKAQVRVFKTNSDVNVYEKLRNLKDYLHYCIEQREYDDKVATAKVNFETFRRNHVEDALQIFDRAVKEKEEESK